MLLQSIRLSKFCRTGLHSVKSARSSLIYCQSPRRLYQSDINKFLSAFPSIYSQKDCEQFWSDIWQKSELFTNQAKDEANAFRILLPPPNITGNLHLGNHNSLKLNNLCFYLMNFHFRPLFDSIHSGCLMSISPNERTASDLVRGHRPCRHCHADGH